MKKYCAMLISVGSCLMPAMAAYDMRADEGTVAWAFLINLLLTFLISTVPILIYRRFIARGPLEKKIAKIVAVLYGIVIFFVSSAILIFVANGEGTVSVYSVVLWSWINYRILISGFERVGSSKTTQQDKLTCKECGGRLSEGASVCPHCGTYLK